MPTHLLLQYSNHNCCQQLRDYITHSNRQTHSQSHTAPTPTQPQYAMAVMWGLSRIGPRMCPQVKDMTHQERYSPMLNIHMQML